MRRQCYRESEPLIELEIEKLLASPQHVQFKKLDKLTKASMAPARRAKDNVFSYRENKTVRKVDSSVSTTLVLLCVIEPNSHTDGLSF